MISSLYEVEIYNKQYDEHQCVHVYAYSEEEAMDRVRDNPKFYNEEIISAYAVED